MKYLSLLAVIFLFSCHSPKQAISSDSPVTEIIFGNGGGYTGQVKTYRLHPDGTLFLTSEQTRQIDSQQTSALFLEAEKYLDYQHEKPGNLYRFIELHTNDKKNRIVWTSPTDDTLKKEILDFYNQLNNLVK